MSHEWKLRNQFVQQHYLVKYLDQAHENVLSKFIIRPILKLLCMLVKYAKSNFNLQYTSFYLGSSYATPT